MFINGLWTNTEIFFDQQGLHKYRFLSTEYLIKFVCFNFNSSNKLLNQGSQRKNLNPNNLKSGQTRNKIVSRLIFCHSFKLKLSNVKRIP